MKGKPWTAEEEKKLRDMITAGCNAHEIAVELKRHPNAVYEKAKRLGLKVIISFAPRKIITSNVQWELPGDLPSIEEQLKVLAAALAALQTPNLDKTEVMRLANIIRGVEVYIARFADYVDYRGLERELVEWREKYAALAEKVKSLQGK